MIGSKLSNLIIRHIETNYNGYVVNVIVASKNGISDLIACIDGNFFAFEVKGKGDKTRRLQDEKLKHVANSGGYGGYVRSTADVDHIITNMIKPNIKSKNNRMSL